MKVCLDSWAVLRWAEATQPVADRVEHVLGQRPVMSWINLGEVYYVMRRGPGEDKAQTVVRDVAARALVEEPDRRRVLAAAAIKADYAMAYADAFAVATAMAHDAVLWTGDPEILDAGGNWRLEDLR